MVVPVSMLCMMQHALRLGREASWSKAAHIVHGGDARFQARTLLGVVLRAAQELQRAAHGAHLPACGL